MNRKFKCSKCGIISSLYDWNTNEKIFNNFTLHEIKDYEEFSSLRERILFSCPSCKQKLVAESIEEISGI